MALLDELEAALCRNESATDLLRKAAAEIRRLTKEREIINVAVTRRIHGYKSDDPIWYTVDHVGEVLKGLEAKREQ